MEPKTIITICLELSHWKKSKLDQNRLLLFKDWKRVSDYKYVHLTDYISTLEFSRTTTFENVGKGTGTSSLLIFLAGFWFDDFAVIRQL